jgi:subtilase family serine protease
MKQHRMGLLIFAFVSFSLTPAVFGETANRPSRMLTRPIDETSRVTLVGNTRPEANAVNDRGAVADSFPMGHMLLQLKRAPESEAALNQYIEDLHNPQSSNFHKWLTPAQFAAQFGAAPEDVDVLSKWLSSKGFTVNGVTPTGLLIEFSGTAGQVKNAFRSEIHNVSVNGVAHIANMSDPQIPAALEPAVVGVVAMHNFMPKPLLVAKKPAYTFTIGTSTYNALVPGDIETIYNINPLLAAGYSGTGQSIMVVEDTYLYSTGDWTVFRKTFGLARPYPHGTLSQVSPSGSLTCVNPGFQGSSSDPGYGDDGEAAIDVEWATAAAPNAAIILAACTDTTAFGGLIALENTLNGPAANLPSVVSISYGESEAVNGAAANLSYSLAYQQAVAEGVSIFVSSGDEDAASSDNGNVATHGITVSGFTSTPYNVSVGGLDFSYTALGVDPSTYWSATNSNTYASALSYIQEIPWNNSCASSITATYLGISPVGLCNNSAVTSSSGSLHFLQDSVGGSGGPSGCATGTASTRGRVSGTCAGYAKPSWQSLVGVPNDGVRDTPDVSLFASNGFWNAYYVTCWSNPDPNVSGVAGGFPCTGAPYTWAGFGGTSVSSPIMAGIQALVNQKTGSRWGNPNTVYYALARGEYGATGSTACNSALGAGVSANCIFYDVTQGDNDAVCKKSGTTAVNCYIPTGDTYGVLSTSTTVDQPAYSSTVGYDLATGIGSVNAYNLVMNWPALVAPTSVSTSVPNSVGGNQ